MYVVELALRLCSFAFFILSHSHRQVHSSEILGVVEHNPSCFLHSTTHTSGPYDSVIDIEGVDTKGAVCVCTNVQSGSGDQDKAVSTNLLPDLKHKVEFDFPWERPQRVIVEETDSDTPPTDRQPSSSTCEVPQEVTDSQSEGGSVHLSPTHIVLRRESVGVRTNRSKEAVVEIKMEDGEEGEADDGIDEGRRREMANEKWKQRKILMDTELRRLKHNENSARRYSGAFIHQALESHDKGIQQRKTQSSSAGINTTRNRQAMFTNTHKPRQKQWRRTTRSKSMLVRTEERVGGIWSTFKNPLFPHDEISDEEEGEDKRESEEQAGLGLPPKDVPFYEKNTMSVLDMSQIPMEEIIQTSDHWNTAGEQDGPFN